MASSPKSSSTRDDKYGDMYDALFESDAFYEMPSSPESSDIDKENNSAIDHLCDSDESYDEYGFRGLNKEEEKQYYQAMLETDGFDVPFFPGTDVVGLIVPISNESLSKEKELRPCAEKAIEEYNLDNGTNFEFVKVVKATHRGACGILYFITFDVKQIGTAKDSPTTTFEARVLSGIPHGVREVELCRPKRTL